MAAKKKKALGLDDVAQEMASKLEPAMNELSKFPKLSAKKKMLAAKKPKTMAEEIDEEIVNDLKKKLKKKLKPIAVPSGETWTGSGWGAHEKGEKLDFDALKTGMVVLEECRQFQARNVVKIIDPPKDFLFFPNRKYGIFVDPKDSRRLRMQSDRMFCVWDFEFKLTSTRVFFAIQE